ncbi:hypothetical protein GS16_05185 [Candidatus Liberibacter solanacearum]|nr:hypothetical protein GS16_05185 [Candidatus Liberibacter solanacearum]KJZ81409.1 hypothetical protein KP07_00470 [Candidatus Liberibacter solanacearum]KQC49042.1 hypothetical protein AP064_02980 [Candidatus Liberibacter solanacearum]
MELIDTNTPSFEDALMQKSGRSLSTNAQDGFMQGGKKIRRLMLRRRDGGRINEGLIVRR